MCYCQLISASTHGNRQVALTLLRCGANINAKDHDGKTSLMVAVINGHQQMLELLLEYNVDLSVVNAVRILGNKGIMIQYFLDYL